MLLFLKTDLYDAFNKLRDCVGSRTFNEKKTTECIWFSNLKFELCDGVITIKDMRYADQIKAREVCNEVYIDKLSALIINTPCEHLRAYKKGTPVQKIYPSGRTREYFLYKDFFKERLKGTTKFTERSFLSMTDEEVAAIAQDLKTMKIKEVAYKYNLSEHFVKKLHYQK